MAKPYVISYLAASIDGYIALDNGSVDFLSRYEDGSVDTGYATFLSGIDVIVMGAKTYEQSLGFGPWSYGDRPCYVLSRRHRSKAAASIHFHDGTVKNLMDNIVNATPEQKNLRVWIVGGADTNTQFLRADLIDEMIITVVPVLLGAGIKVFNSQPQTRWFTTQAPQQMGELIQLHYTKPQ